MVYIKIIFALILTIRFFYDLIYEQEFDKKITTFISYILFVIIVANKNFF